MIVVGLVVVGIVVVFGEESMLYGVVGKCMWFVWVAEGAAMALAEDVIFYCEGSVLLDAKAVVKEALLFARVMSCRAHT